VEANDGMSRDFFDQLPVLEAFSDVLQFEAYRLAPADWSLVITDVQGSTKAIEAGLYKHVNALGAASIAAVRNSVPEVSLPFVFGGDGATLLVPDEFLEPVARALLRVQITAKAVFDLGLRIGAVSVGELAEDGHEVRVARYKASENIHLAMFAGTGVSEAERRIKSEEIGERYAFSGEPDEHADLSGFQCRWTPIQAKKDHVVSLMVRTVDSDPVASALIYNRVLEGLNRVLKGEDGRPVSPDSLNLTLKKKWLQVEAHVGTGSTGGFAHFKAILEAYLGVAFGWIVMKLGIDTKDFPGSRYKEQVTANSDFRKFDDTLRMVVDITKEQVADIRTLLETEYEKRAIYFGTHVADSALITCVIERFEGEHYHFIDGDNGGYALAAKEMKAQMKRDREAAVPGS
jgi:hypothetical protein